MKIGNRKEKASRTVNPSKNQSKRNFLLIVVIVITVLLIMWVYRLGKKAEETVSVVMWKDSVYKNQVITESMMVEYKMLKGEFDKYAIENDDGTKSRRIILWEERGKIINNFAAYPLKPNTIAFVSDVIISRTDNTNTVLYSFPGKNIVSLQLAENDLRTFKTFIEPGDRVNVTAIYTAEETVEYEDEYGKLKHEKVTTTRQEIVFRDIMVADLLNNDGESVLDLYASYKEMTSWRQAQLDADESWQKRTQPTTLLVALTPEEEALYYDYMSKDQVEFMMSLPQRID